MGALGNKQKKIVLIGCCAIIQLLVINIAILLLASNGESGVTHLAYSSAGIFVTFVTFYTLDIQALSAPKHALLGFAASLLMQYLGLLTTVMIITPFDWLTTLKTVFNAIGWVIVSNVYLLPVTALLTSVFFLFFWLYKQVHKPSSSEITRVNNAII